MGILYVARSAKLCRWASDVGLGKHVYKVGVTEGDPRGLAAAGWAGETDWTITRKQSVEDLSEEEALERLARKEKLIEPNLYPKLKEAAGVFRLTPSRVESNRFRRLSDPQHAALSKPAPPFRYRGTRFRSPRAGRVAAEYRSASDLARRGGRGGWSGAADLRSRTTAGRCH
jgi:hypothetical protein